MENIDAEKSGWSGNEMKMVTSTWERCSSKNEMKMIEFKLIHWMFMCVGGSWVHFSRADIFDGWNIRN